MIGRVEDATFEKHALAAAEIDIFPFEALEPRVLVSIGEKEKQALDLHAGTVFQQFLQANRAQVGKPAEQGVDLFKRLVVG